MLSVTQNWKQLALNVTHFGRKQYFTVIDCGLSRFAVWREVKSENASEICDNLEEIFRERRPPDQLLLEKVRLGQPPLLQESIAIVGGIPELEKPLSLRQRRGAWSIRLAIAWW